MSTERSAFILGYTGETGKALVQELNQQKCFKRVYLIGRREVRLAENLGQEFEQRLLDFNDLEAYKNVFQDLEVGFCCLGTTRSKAGSKEGFIKIDHDYVLSSAEIAKNMGCKHFIVVSSNGANKNSCILYTRTKGEVEEDLKCLNFEKLTILRPSLLLCDREESRTCEGCFRCCFKCFPMCCRRYSAIHTQDLAKYMVYKALHPSKNSIETIENQDMYDYEL